MISLLLAAQSATIGCAAARIAADMSGYERVADAEAADGSSLLFYSNGQCVCSIHVGPHVSQSEPMACEPADPQSSGKH